MANCSAINSNDIFLMRAGIPSSWEMCPLCSGFFSPLTPYLEGIKQWRKRRKEEWKSPHLELWEIILKSIFKTNNSRELVNCYIAHLKLM